MRSVSGFLQKTAVCLMLVTSFAMAAPVPLRLDLYDISDNHLMYLTFAYDASGRNTGRAIYMADGTFMRNIAINYDALGQRSSEVSYNFNGDTIYVNTYLQSGNKTTFSIQDQFKQDFAGGNIGYSNSDPLKFELSFQQGGKRAASVNYTTEPASGNLQRVDIVGQSDRDSYYGLFTYGEATGVSHPVSKADKHPQASVRMRASRIDVDFNLKSAGDVRCELLTLSGRRAALLFNGKVQEGRYTRHLNPGRDAAGQIADGVYLFKVSVNGAGISHSKYLHQSSMAGGVR